MRNVSVGVNADNQIVITIGTESRAGETYYLGLQPDSESHDFRPALGTLQLVSEWIRLLSDLPENQPQFLPFDFSDECTRWMMLRRTGREIEITLGWAVVEGWAISVRDLSLYRSQPAGFRPDEPLVTQTFYLPRVLSNLRACRENLRISAEQEKCV